MLVIQVQKTDAYFAYEHEEQKVSKAIDGLKDEIKTVKQKIAETGQALYRSKAKDLGKDPSQLQEMEITLKQMEAYRQELISRLGVMYEHIMQIYRTSYSDVKKRNS